MPRARSILLGLLAAAGLGFAPVAGAQDYTSDSNGGPGGAPFTLRCAEGDFLVGVSVRSGDWIDAVAPQCARWDAARQRFLPPGVGPMQGGGGGDPSEHVCPNDSAIAYIQVEQLPGQRGNVTMLALGCHSVRTLASTSLHQFGTTREDRELRAAGVESSTITLDNFFGEHLQCHDGDFAVGIYGGAGVYLDRIGLICAPRPFVTQTAGQRTTAPVANSVPQPVPSRGNVTAGANTRVAPEPPPSRVTAGVGLRVTPERQRPRRCIDGYTWRMARIPDPVCVTLQAHQLAQSENAAAPSRVDPNGAWGPASCLSGYVWREAFDGDTVCVTPPRRAQVREENRVAPNFQSP